MIYKYGDMKTITIDVLNDKVWELLKELEALKLVKFNRIEKNPNKDRKASSYKGIITPESGAKLQESIRQSRTEW